MIDHEAQKALNIKHAANPESGDYWHEMFSPSRLVIRVDNGIVEYLDAAFHYKQVAADHWTWDVNKQTCLCKVEEFSKFLHYTSEAMKEEFIADVVPNSPNHAWAVEAYIQGINGLLKPGQ